MASKLFLFLALSFCTLSSCRENDLRRGNADIIKTALDWGGLAALPEDAKIVSAKSAGSAFTREVIVVFTCSKESIDKWIQASKRLKNNIPGHIALNVYRYEILPGEEGSVGGKVDVDYSTGIVLIDISWS